MTKKSMRRNNFIKMVREGKENGNKAFHLSGKNIRFPHKKTLFSRPSQSDPRSYLQRNRLGGGEKLEKLENSKNSKNLKNSKNSKNSKTRKKRKVTSCK